MCDEKLKIILEHYGLNHQRIKACEELAELIQAIIKGDDTHIAEEIADVEIMLDQLKEGYKFNALVEQFKEMKIERQLRRIKEK